MANRVVGIYMSSTHVDIIELGGSVSAPRLFNFIREKVTSRQYEVLEEDEKKIQSSLSDYLSLTVKDGMEKIKVKTTGIYSVMPSTDVMVRYFSMPPLPRSEQETAVKFEARKYIPFKVDEIVSDFKILPPSKIKKTIDVFFIATPKDRLNNHIEVFKKAGTKPIGIDVVPFALIRVLLLCKKLSARENAVILYIDSDRQSVAIYIFEMGLPFLSRDLKINADDKEAFFEKIGSELRLSIDYYYRQTPKVEIAKVVICGETIYSGLDAYVADELKIVTETLDRIVAIKGPMEVPASAIIAVGAALGGLKKSRYSINLSPTAAVIKKKKMRKLLLTEVAVAAFIIVLVFSICSIQLTRVSTKLKAIGKDGSAYKVYAAGLSLDALRQSKESKLGELEFIRLLINERVSWTEKLDILAKNIPKEVWIDTLTIRDVLVGTGKSVFPSNVLHDISIEGKAFSLDAAKEIVYINKFFDSIKNNASFTHSLEGLELAPTDKKDIRGYPISTFRILTNGFKTPPPKEETRWHRGRR